MNAVDMKGYKMEYVKRGRKPSPYWAELVHLGDDILLPKGKKKIAKSLKDNAWRRKLVLSVKTTLKGESHVVVVGLIKDE
jgi:hypothetical protein